MTCKEQDAMCLKGECENCGYKKIKERFKNYEEKNGDETVKYHRWETINIETTASGIFDLFFVDFSSEKIIVKPDFILNILEINLMIFSCKPASKNISALTIITYGKTPIGNRTRVIK